jgi:5-methylthioadenosine/S-adenosylhomocysteine deaminase
MKTLIKNAVILTMNSAMDVIEDGYMVIDADRIVALGAGEYHDAVDSVIDAERAILMPGMINTHTHVGMIPFRSLGDDCQDRLRRYLFPLENDCMTADLAYASARYAIAEMLLGGVTTFVDMYYFEDKIAQAVDEMGARALLGETIIDFKTCDTDKPYGGLDYCEWFIPKWLDHPRITPYPAPHATNTNSVEALKRANALSQQFQVPISLHVAEMDYEMAHFKEVYDQTPIEFLDSIGLLNERLIAAHCIHLTDSDIALMAARGSSVAHCIGANTKAAKGVAPVKQMLANGIAVGLGTDGPASGNTIDVMTQFKLFADFQKSTNRDRSLFPARQIVELGTISAAKAIGLDAEIGSLEIGKKADFILLETNSVNMFPIFDPYSAIVYSANPANVDTVFVDGRCLVRHKTLQTASLPQLREALDRQMGPFKVKAREYSRDL